MSHKQCAFHFAKEKINMAFFNPVVAFYSLLLLSLTFLMRLIIEHAKNKPPLQITLVDLVNIDLSYSYFLSCFSAVFISLCIEAQLLPVWPQLALICSWGFEFVAIIFQVYINIGIVIRFILIWQGHLEGCCALLDDDVRLIIRLFTAAFSKN